VRVAPGVFRIAGCPVTWQQRALAACLAGAGCAVVSHLTAAAVFGLGVAPLLPHVTVPVGASARSRLARVHRAPLDARDLTHLMGMPVTTASRTIVDVAMLLPRQAFFDLVDTALQRRLATRDGVLSVGDRLATDRGRRGRAALLLDDALSVWTPGPAPDSPAEMRMIRRLVEWGFRMPERQHVVRDANRRFVARIDLAWPDSKIGLEYDGVEAHGPRRVESDDRRQARLEALGWHIVRAEKADVRPGARRLRAELERAFAATCARTDDISRSAHM
jgi:very-short-patch-repair endonuclease